MQLFLICVFDVPGNDGDNWRQTVPRVIPHVFVAEVVVRDDGKAFHEGGIVGEGSRPCEGVGVPRAVVGVEALDA